MGYKRQQKKKKSPRVNVRFDKGATAAKFWGDIATEMKMPNSFSLLTFLHSGSVSRKHLNF